MVWLMLIPLPRLKMVIYAIDVLAADLKAGLVVPSKSNRKFPRSITKGVYKRRNIMERIIGRLKDFRRVSMRFEKTDSNFFGFVYVAALLHNLKSTVNTPKRHRI